MLECIVTNIPASIRLAPFEKPDTYSGGYITQKLQKTGEPAFEHGILGGCGGGVMSIVTEAASSHQATHIALLEREIERIVTNAKTNGTVLRPPQHSALLSASYPGAGFSAGRIIDHLIIAAMAAGVPVEVGRPARPQAYGFVLQP